MDLLLYRLQFLLAFYSRLRRLRCIRCLCIFLTFSLIFYISFFLLAHTLALLPCIRVCRTPHKLVLQDILALHTHCFSYCFCCIQILALHTHCLSYCFCWGFQFFRNVVSRMLFNIYTWEFHTLYRNHLHYFHYFYLKYNHWYLELWSSQCRNSQKI